MLESEVQSKLINALKHYGYCVCKVMVCSMNGFPDIMAIKEGKVLLIEVKRPGQKPRPLQIHCHKVLANHGLSPIVYDGTIDPKQFVYDTYITRQSESRN